VFDAEVVCLETDEGAAYGAALQAMWTYKNGIGEKISIQELTDRYVRVDEEMLAHPISANVKIYRELQKIQDNVSLALRKTFIKHRKFLTRHIA
jgi:sugar (pentulose or hexulose) kinase